MSVARPGKPALKDSLGAAAANRNLAMFPVLKTEDHHSAPPSPVVGECVRRGNPRPAVRHEHGRPGAALGIAVASFILAWYGLAAAQPFDAPEALAAQADAIVLATCVATDSDWDPELQVIVTRATVRVDRSFTGDAGPLLTVHLLGGRVGRHGMGAAHGPALAPGERSVLFVRRSRHGPYFVVCGGAAGKLPVRARADGTEHIEGMEADDLDAFAAWAATRGGAP